jgi:AhpD family alkylhydroperoxidase
LIKMRASQLNGCAHCLDMHSKDARQRGETEQRLYLLNAWRETSLFSARERAALAWTEALTFVAETRVPDDVYDDAHAQFSDRELMDLTLAVAAINSWNRIAISFLRRSRQLPTVGSAKSARLAVKIASTGRATSRLQTDRTRPRLAACSALLVRGFDHRECLGLAEILRRHE